MLILFLGFITTIISIKKKLEHPESTCRVVQLFRHLIRETNTNLNDNASGNNRVKGLCSCLSFSRDIQHHVNAVSLHDTVTAVSQCS